MAPNSTDMNCTSMGQPSFHPRTANMSDTPQELLYDPNLTAQNNNIPCYPVPAVDGPLFPPIDPMDWEASMELLNTLHWYYVPPLMALGIFGNLLVVCFLLSRALRRESSSHYLVALSLADAAFLGSLFSLWISVLGIDLYNRRGWCQLMSFMTSLSTFLPLWYVVLFAIDRALVHYRAANSSRGHGHGGPLRVQIAVIGVLIVGVVIHVNTSLTVGVVDFPGFEKCMVLPRFIPYLKLFSLVDSVVNIIIPYTIILVALLSIVCTPFRRHRCKDSPCGTWDSTGNQSADVTKLTWLTILVLSVFLLTRLPSEVFRLINMGRNFSDALSHPDPQEFLIQQLAQKLLLLSYAIKPPIYVFLHPMLGRSWRWKLRSIYLRRQNTVATVTSLENHVISIEEETPLNEWTDVTRL